MAGKKRGGTAQAVWQLAQPLAASLGLTLWDVRFLKEGADWVLRLYIDKEGGVGIDDCVNMTHAVDKPLDEADLISGAYTLEVSSPGINRELTRPDHFEKYRGHELHVRFIRPFADGSREVIGTLRAFDDPQLTLENGEGETMTFSRAQTAWIRLCEEDEQGTQEATE